MGCVCGFYTIYYAFINSYILTHYPACMCVCIAILYDSQRRHPEAEEAHRECLRLRKLKLGEA